ncbi:hypothetical protein [[Collinsella] massiliensis]|uniref:Cucumopine synthase C-terminal helical bundle domain-containing protein n=1 Tax=[Collinsella] massiliensis TaxID=1232426 RepID=A0A1Y3XUP5_9ACTN|nr:hypothetical protein [[Collinsella] massiliensis]OUN86997.1 hypothetical protein B5G02_08045 [[Collinsella] massiliensis]
MATIEHLSGLTAGELASALRVLADDMVCNEPEDIERLRARKLDTGREFAVWEYVMGYCMNFSDQICVLRTQADAVARGEEPGDAATLARSMQRLCAWYSGQFDTTAKMDDAVAILAHAGECFGGVCDLAAFSDLARGLERYLVQLMFWVDRQIPWSAVSDLVHGYRLRTAK